MKNIAAVLIMLAVLNPLCCCWSKTQASEEVTSMQTDHSCCNPQSDSEESDDQENSQANCGHEDVKDSTLTAATSISVPSIQVAHQLDMFQEPYDLKYLRRSMASFEKDFKASQSIQRWVGVQTDCVRRL